MAVEGWPGVQRVLKVFSFSVCFRNSGFIIQTKGSEKGLGHALGCTST